MSGPWIVAFVALWVTTLLVALVLLGVLRRMTGVLERAEAILAGGSGAGVGGAPVGSAIPPFEAFDADGAAVPSSALLRRPTVVLFIAPGCSPCHRLLTELGTADEDVEGTPVVVVTEDSPEGRTLAMPAEARAVFQRNRAVSHAFQNASAPQAFLIDENSIVLARNVPNSLDNLRDLVRHPKGGDADAPEAAAVLTEIG